jgi:predicted DsbA family dithiol-disulfide isomerase
MASTPLQTLNIDFVSDVACPWCAIGLASLDQALARIAPEVTADVRFQPFELNPHMGPEGEDVAEHLAKKYGSTPEQQEAARDNIRQRGAAVGFGFRKEGRGRIWNTFDAHRLLFWAGQQSAALQHALKRALLESYHGEGRNPSDADVLLDAVVRAGLDRDQAAAVLADPDRHAADVRRQEAYWQNQGIRSVPAVVINGKYLVSGGQPPEVFEEALRKIAAEAAA